MDVNISTHICNDQTPLAYTRREGQAGVDVVFLGGFKSDMNGSKATFLDEYCAAHSYGFLRFDYAGHGASGGDFMDGSIGLWLDNALEMIDAHTQHDLIVVGSSMGGWLALEVARYRAERLRGLVGIAAAPDFTEELMWENFTQQQQEALMQEGHIMLPSAYEEDYPITRTLIEDARQRLFFKQPPLDVPCPVTLLHGMRDEDVPWSYALRIAEHIAHEKVDVQLIKSGDHRLSRIEDLVKLAFIIETMIHA